MKFMEVSKDGGPESHVWAYWLFEIKWLCSIVLLKFEDGTRPVYHSHAFNSISWLLSGELLEYDEAKDGFQLHWPSWLSPIMTYRSTTHMVRSVGRSWVLSFRGPWADTWIEKSGIDTVKVLSHGRKEVW